MLTQPFLFGLSLASLATLAAAREARSPRYADFDWSTIEPSPELEYHDCHEGFRCAKLQMPLDWQDPSNNATVAIAISSLPAVVPESDPSFGGSIFLNPGGPGGSGTIFMLANARRLQQIADGNKHYEMVSFDPRGIARSTPTSDCYGDEFARQAVNWQLRGLPLLTNDSSVVDEHLPFVHAHGKLCARNEEETRQFFSTPAVARDMLGIVDAIDVLRKKTLQAARLGDGLQKVIRDDDKDAEGASKEDGLPRLQYMGFSYGTMLGNTFATLFPGRVGRVMLDGVVDPYDYSGGFWQKNLMDAQHIIDEFFDSCFALGDRCTLREPSDTSGQSIRARVEAFIEALEASPALFLPPDATMPVVIRSADVRGLILAALYFPIRTFMGLEMVLSLAMAGELGPLASIVNVPTASDSCSRFGPPAPVSTYSWNSDAQLTYICGDAESVVGTTTEEFAELVGGLEELAPLIASVWSQLMVDCLGWTARPKWRFAGPFVSPPANASIEPGKPAAPLLILSSRYDPVTPLVNARKASKGHPGSTVVVQNSSGHCAVFAAPSKCTKKIVERFFEFGEVPADDTVCEGDCQPFETCPEDGFVALSWEDSLKDALPRFPLGI